jgi:hypothetical protein
MMLKIENFCKLEAVADYASKKKKNKKIALQISLWLLRYLFTSYFSFLFRVLSPTEMHFASARLESTFQLLFPRIFHLHLSSTHDPHWLQVWLPFRFGGLGFSLPSDTSISAFSASANTFFLSNYLFILPHFSLPSFLASASSLAVSVSQAIARTDQIISFHCKSSSSKFPLLAASTIPLSRDTVLQKHFAAFTASSKKDFFENLPRTHDQKQRFFVRIRALQQKSSTAFLHAIPSSFELSIPSHHFPYILSSFLDLPFPRKTPASCFCRDALLPHDMGEHMSLCMSRGSLTAHNCIVSCIEAMAREAGHTISGPSQLLHLSPSANTVGDCRINSSIPFDPSVVVDVEIINILAPSSFDRAGYPLPMLENIVKSKTTKHFSYLSVIGEDFSPFIVSRFCSLPHASRDLFTKLVEEIPSACFSAPNWSARSPSSYWKQRLSVCLWSSLAEEVFIYCHRCLNAFGAEVPHNV